MQSLQHYARITIYKSDVDYSHIPRNVYLSLGLPNVKVLDVMRQERLMKKTLFPLLFPLSHPDLGLTISAKLGCMHSLVFFKSIGATKIDIAVEKAARYGHIQIVQICKEWGLENLNNAMYKAVRGCHVDIINLLQSWGAEWQCLPFIYEHAAYYGNYDIVKLLLESDNEYAEPCFEAAACGGHTNILRLCRKHGASDFENALFKSIRFGHVEVLKLYKEWGILKYFDDAMVEASEYGHIEMVKLCKEYGAVSFGRAYRRAVDGSPSHVSLMNDKTYEDSHRRRELINLLQQWKNTHYDWIMMDAAKNGDMELLKECKAKGAVAYNKALKYAAWNGHVETVKLLYSWGANDFDSAVIHAVNERNFHILELFKEWNVDIDFDKALGFTLNPKSRLLLLDWKLSSHAQFRTSHEVSKAK